MPGGGNSNRRPVCERTQGIGAGLYEAGLQVVEKDKARGYDRPTNVCVM